MHSSQLKKKERCIFKLFFFYRSSVIGIVWRDGDDDDDVVVGDGAHNEFDDSN